MKLYVVGIGCGNHDGMTFGAEKAILASDLVVGYTVYAEQIKQMYPEKECLSTGMRRELERVEIALKSASEGKTVSLVCSGDSELYGMAGLAFELAVKYPAVEVETVAGVSAVFSGGAVLGSPVTYDTVIISLSDLLTPMEKIEKRLKCAAEGDFVIAIYNPSSKKRHDYLRRACDILLAYRSPETVCGYVKNIGRDGEKKQILTLEELRETEVDMFTTVFVGSSETKVINGKMVTPRGYRDV